MALVNFFNRLRAGRVDLKKSFELRNNFHEL